MVRFKIEPLKIDRGDGRYIEIQDNEIIYKIGEKAILYFTQNQYGLYDNKGHVEIYGPKRSFTTDFRINEDGEISYSGLNGFRIFNSKGMEIGDIIKTYMENLTSECTRALWDNKKLNSRKYSRVKKIQTLQKNCNLILGDLWDNTHWIMDIIDQKNNPPKRTIKKSNGVNHVDCFSNKMRPLLESERKRSEESKISRIADEIIAEYKVQEEKRRIKEMMIKHKESLGHLSL